MAKPQQPELRRSGRVEALDPDATEAKRGADRRRRTTSPDGPVPEDQRPGHHPEHDQDKPDLDKFAARLGVVKEGEEPEDSAHVDPDEVASRDIAVGDDGRPEVVPHERRQPASIPGLKLLFLGPAIGYVVGRRIVRKLTGRN